MHYILQYDTVAGFGRASTKSGLRHERVAFVMVWLVICISRGYLPSSTKSTLYCMAKLEVIVGVPCTCKFDTMI